MKLHEKSLELNITHELLNLADCWYWFLTDIPLWKYWRPRYRLPFLRGHKSTAAGFHITTEGKSDPTGEAGGGFDVRINSGIGGHLLFIQYKLGEFFDICNDPESIFNSHPQDYYKFKINSTTTNQHFLLQELANGIGSNKGNAVVYAFPLIKNMEEMEENAGKLIRKTKFVSISDIDNQAKKAKTPFVYGQEHSFKIGKYDFNRCEMNLLLLLYQGEDRTNEVITDIVALRFQRILSDFVKDIEVNFKNYELYIGYIGEGLLNAFKQYLRYLFHYFEVSPNKVNWESNSRLTITDLLISDGNFMNNEEFEEYANEQRDIGILNSIFKALDKFLPFIYNLTIENGNGEYIINKEVPIYVPNFFIPIGNGFNFSISEAYPFEAIENISYLVV